MQSSPSSQRPLGTGERPRHLPSHSPPAAPKSVPAGSESQTSNMLTSGIPRVGKPYTRRRPGAPGSPIDHPPIVSRLYFLVTYSAVCAPCSVLHPLASPLDSFSSPVAEMIDSVRSARTTKVMPPTAIATATFDVAPRYLVLAAITTCTSTSQPHPGSSTFAYWKAPIPIKSKRRRSQFRKWGSPLDEHVLTSPTAFSSAGQLHVEVALLFVLRSSVSSGFSIVSSSSSSNKDLIRRAGIAVCVGAIITSSSSSAPRIDGG